MRPKALEAGNRLVQVDQRPIGVERLVVEGDSGPGDVVGGFGAQLREAWQRSFRCLDGRGFQFSCHAVPLSPLDARRFEAPSL